MFSFKIDKFERRLLTFKRVLKVPYKYSRVVLAKINLTIIVIFNFQQLLTPKI